MSAVAGVFASRKNAEHAVDNLVAAGLPADRVVLLTPDTPGKETEALPTSETEQPGMGKAVGGVVGGAAGLAGGIHLGSLASASAAVPGVGPVIALGLLGGAILGLSGVRVGGALENKMAKGLPADELFVYEDALRKGRSVVIAFPDEASRDPIQKAMSDEGAESVDAARKQWWIGLRSAEKERYSVPGRAFEQDEKFYRMGFEAALDSKHRGKQSDQVLSEIESELHDPQRRHSDADVRAFRLGFERGLEYFHDTYGNGS